MIQEDIKELEEYWKPSKYAKWINMSLNWVMEEIRAGRIPAKKFGTQWRVIIKSEPIVSSEIAELETEKKKLILEKDRVILNNDILQLRGGVVQPEEVAQFREEEGRQKGERVRLDEREKKADAVKVELDARDSVLQAQEKEAEVSVRNHLLNVRDRVNEIQQLAENWCNVVNCWINEVAEVSATFVVANNQEFDNNHPERFISPKEGQKSWEAFCKLANNFPPKLEFDFSLLSLAASGAGNEGEFEDGDEGLGVLGDSEESDED